LVGGNFHLFFDGGSVMKFIRVRVKAENGARYAALLCSAGYQARWLGPGTASSATMSGCTDPHCCYQHECFTTPLAWGSVETNASGSVAHRVWNVIGQIC
jgi:hypothetical protein